MHPKDSAPGPWKPKLDHGPILRIIAVLAALSLLMSIVDLWMY